MTNLLPTKENPHPLLSLKGPERNRYAIRTFIFTVTVTVVLYLFPSYYGLEVITTQSSYFLLNLFGFYPRLFIYEDSLNNLGKFDQALFYLYDSARATYPAISIDNGYSRSNYLIVRACTGMQAGALLLGLIWSTPAKKDDKIRASYTMLIALFIGNAARIAAMIAITSMFMTDYGVDYTTSWKMAHDVMGQPLGFFGTIGFTLLIEKRNVRILDTIQVWMDALFSIFTK